VDHRLGVTPLRLGLSYHISLWNVEKNKGNLLLVMKSLWGLEFDFALGSEAVTINPNKEVTMEQYWEG